jgi:putative flippase GtrA
MPTVARQLPRFAVVGAAATLVHVAVATLLHDLAGLSPLTSNGGGFAASVSISYLGNLRWTFGRDCDHAFYAPRFLLAALFGFVVGQAAMQLSTAGLGLPFKAALAAVALLVPVMNFIIARYWALAERRERASRWVGGAAATSLLAAYGGWLTTTTLNHDVQWYLIGTARWLDGATLYRDVVEVNPPLAFVLTLPPVAAARLLTIAPADAFIAYILLLAGGSLAATWSLWRRIETPAAAAGMVVAGAVALLVYPLPQFGQREHLTLILSLPYLTLACVRTRGGRVGLPYAVAVGTVATLGLALKPYFLAVPLLIACGAAWQERRWRAALTPEHAAIGIAVMLYAAAIPAFFPAFFSEVLPIARIAYEAGYTAPLAAVALRPEPLLGLVLASTVVWLSRSGAQWRRLTPLALAVAGYGAAYLIQQKGWFYQRVPLGGCAILLATGVALQNRWNARGAIALGVALCLTGPSVVEGPYRNDLPAAINAAVPGLGSDSRVYSLGQWLRPGVSVAAELGGTWCSRYPALWPIPGAAISSDPAAERLIDATRRSVVQDFISCGPTLVVVEPPSRDLRNMKPHFDYLALMLADPGFAALWRNYKFAGALPTGHRIWVRA